MGTEANLRRKKSFNIAFKHESRKVLGLYALRELKPWYTTAVIAMWRHQVADYCCVVLTAVCRQYDTRTIRHRSPTIAEHWLLRFFLSCLLQLNKCKISGINISAPFRLHNWSRYWPLVDDGYWEGNPISATSTPPDRSLWEWIADQSRSIQLLSTAPQRFVAAFQGHS